MDTLPVTPSKILVSACLLGSLYATMAARNRCRMHCWHSGVARTTREMQERRELWQRYRDKRQANGLARAWQSVPAPQAPAGAPAADDFGLSLLDDGWWRTASPPRAWRRR